MSSSNATGQARATALAFGLFAGIASIRSARAGEAPDELHRPRPSLELSLVARDWEGARPIVGRLVATDYVRPAHSDQLLMGRLRLSVERVATFVQFGVGYWRPDDYLSPRQPTEVDKAGQLGAGIEWTISSIAAVALESRSTILMRDRLQGPSTCVRGVALGEGMLVGRVSF